MKLRTALPLAIIAAALQALPGRATETFAYGPDPAQRLDVCMPPVAATRRPALLMIHGGGWRSGSRTSQAQECAFLGRLGVVAITADYRLSTGAPGTTWPAQLQDVQLALRWVRAHAAAYGIDPDRICAEGESAGAHLALMLGVVPSIEPGDMQSFLPNVSPHADCVVAISAPSDLARMARFRPPLIANLLGPQDAARARAMEIAASPALIAKPGHAAPTLLVHGLDDPAVPFDQATEMQAALVKAGTPSWLITHPGGHGLNGLSGRQAKALFVLIARFAAAPNVLGPPRQLPAEEALGHEE